MTIIIANLSGRNPFVRYMSMFSLLFFLCGRLLCCGLICGRLLCCGLICGRLLGCRLLSVAICTLSIIPFMSHTTYNKAALFAKHLMIFIVNFLTKCDFRVVTASCRLLRAFLRQRRHGRQHQSQGQHNGK